MVEESGEDRVALVLDAGGARSAYQVGVLQELLPALARQGHRPSVLVGTSAGALLSTALASAAHLDAEEQAAQLSTLLSRATKENVIRPLWRQTPMVLARYASETLGLSLFRLRGLFGTSPLARTLAREIHWEDVHDNVAAGRVTALAVTATAVRTGQVVLFTETTTGLPAPRPHRRFVPTALGVEHLMASAAIPGLFPSVQVHSPQQAAGWYADGATRRRVPLAPALELDADRVVAVGTGSIRALAPDPERDSTAVDMGDSAAVLLGAMMDDPLRHDLRRLAEVNALAEDPDLAPTLDRHRAGRARRPYRPVPYVAVAPVHGDELAARAMEVFRSNHKRLLRSMTDPDLHLVHRLLGSDSPLQGELLSYLLFDEDFFDEATELGRRDARRWIDAHPGLWTTGPLGDDGTPQPP